MMTEHRDNRDIAGQSGTCPCQYCRDGRDTPLGGVLSVPLARSYATQTEIKFKKELKYEW